MSTRLFDKTAAVASGGPPATADELAARRAAVAEVASSTLLVVDTAEPRLATIQAWARRRAGVRAVFATTITTAEEVASCEPPEVAVVNLLFEEGRGIAVASLLRLLVPNLEIAFVVEDTSAPEVQAAWDLGWQRIVAAEGLEAWLDRGLLPLCRLARLRRQTLAAEISAAELSAGDVVPTPSDLPLSVAERRYRETFLRAKLATAGGRREAARLAGVPYTTFCVMLRKLGIRG
jgi:hypothetical protein